MVNHIAEAYGDDTAFIIKHKEKGEVSYENISFKEFHADVNAIGTAMLARGWQGKRIAVIGANSYHWMATFFATLGGVGTTVPLDKGLPYEELESCLARSYAEVLVFDKGHKDLVAKLIEEGKIFYQVSYPMRSHSISEGAGTTQHLRKTLENFWLKHLPAGGM